MNNPAHYEKDIEREDKVRPQSDSNIGLRKWLCELDDRVSAELAVLRRAVFIFSALFILGAGLLIAFGWLNLRNDFSEQHKEHASHLAALSTEIETMGNAAQEIKANVDQLAAVQKGLTNQATALSAAAAESHGQISSLVEQLKKLQTQNNASARRIEMLSQNFSRTKNTINEIVAGMIQLESVSNRLDQVSKQVVNVSASLDALPVLANRISALEAQTNMISALNNQSLQLNRQIVKLRADINALSARLGKLESEEVQISQ